MLYFGVDEQAALEKWAKEKDDLIAGRVPRARQDGNSQELHNLCNQFLNTKRRLLEAGELSPHSWKDYERVCKSLTAAFGRERLLTDILPEDFETLRATWAAKWGPVRLGNEINRVRVVFNYGFKSGLLAQPMRFGEGFNRPSRKTLRLARAEKGIRMFEADELRRIIKAAAQPMKAMILLGANCGFGNADVGRLPLDALDLAGGWIGFARGKTGIMRRCPLWPETVKALREWLKARPAAADPADDQLVFTTAKGGSWFKSTSDNPVSKEMRKLLDRLKINGHRNFYSLRHGFETIAGASRDQVAVGFIMGHADNSMSAEYRERIDDDRLQAVVEHVRAWLFGKTRKTKAS
jgi:integrase